jgi:hypothetical protein
MYEKPDRDIGFLFVLPLYPVLSPQLIELIHLPFISRMPSYISQAVFHAKACSIDK